MGFLNMTVILFNIQILLNLGLTFFIDKNLLNKYKNHVDGKMFNHNIGNEAMKELNIELQGK